jgi:hypothetical protein
MHGVLAWAFGRRFVDFFFCTVRFTELSTYNHNQTSKRFEYKRIEQVRCMRVACVRPVMYDPGRTGNHIFQSTDKPTA